ncbi:hypothetical protein ACW23B_13140 [Streptomyces albidoflavus]
MGIVTRELSELYAAAVRGTPGAAAAARPVPRLLRLAARRPRARGRRQRAHWRESRPGSSRWSCPRTGRGRPCGPRRARSHSFEVPPALARPALGGRPGRWRQPLHGADGRDPTGPLPLHRPARHRGGHGRLGP